MAVKNREQRRREARAKRKATTATGGGGAGHGTPPSPPSGPTPSPPPSKKTWLKANYRSFLLFGTRVAVLPIWLAAVMATSLLTASYLLFFALVIAGVNIFVVSTARMQLKIVMFSIIVIVFVSTGWIVYRNTEADVPVPLLNSEISAFDQFNQFLGNKSEYEIMTTFDFANMIQYNCMMYAAKLQPDSQTSSQLKQANEYFAGGEALASEKYGRITGYTDGTFKMVENPGTEMFLNLSPRYVLAINKLKQMSQNPLLPSNVRQRLGDLYHAVEADTSLILDIENDAAKKDPELIIRDSDATFQYDEYVEGQFAILYKPLLPFVQAVNAAIQRDLGVN